MSSSLLNLFASKAENFFSPHLQTHGYQLQETKYLLYSVNLIYYNQHLGKFIKVQNAIHPYDYGFTIFEGDTEEPERNILLNLPNEKQDSDYAFLEKVGKDFFSNDEIITQLTAELSKNINRIILQY